MLGIHVSSGESGASAIPEKKKKTSDDPGDNQFKNGQNQKQIRDSFSYHLLSTEAKQGLVGSRLERQNTQR